MALFFDQNWFDTKLEACGKTHSELAEKLDIPIEDLAAIWKDQREISQDEVHRMASFLNESPGDVAKRSGISTPAPDEFTKHSFQSVEGEVGASAILSRLKALEIEVARLKAAVLELSDPPK